MEKILSISVAAYNLGSMIEDNINSFCNSNVSDYIELIITDDGSKDDTVKIVEEYSLKYPNVIKLIKKENEGPGSTVNSGIKNATGKYFKMVDGDDWVDSKNLEGFVEFLKTIDVDMVFSDYSIFDNQNKTIIENITFDLKAKEALSFEDCYKACPCQMHAIAFKTSILKDNNIRLDNCFYTDVEYVLYPIKYVNTVAYYDSIIYIYRVAQSGQSVSIPSMKRNVAQHEMVLNNLLEYYTNNVNSFTNSQKEYIANRIGSMVDVQLGTYLYFDPSKEYKNKIKIFINNIKNEYKDIYKYFKKSKKFKSLYYSKYILYKYISKKYTKKMSK